jgi:hypothetical protein
MLVSIGNYLHEIVLCLNYHIVVVCQHRLENHAELAHKTAICLLIKAHI